MPQVIQVLSYICEFIFLCLLFIFIMSCLIRLLGVKANYNADEDEKRIEFRCLTATKQYLFGKTNVNLGQGTYVIGTSVFSELRIAKAKTHFSGILEVLDSDECHLYINSGSILINNEKYEHIDKAYICLFPGDVFTIGEQTCMINSLSANDEEEPDENNDTVETEPIDEDYGYYYNDYDEDDDDYYDYDDYNEVNPDNTGYNNNYYNDNNNYNNINNYNNNYYDNNQNGGYYTHDPNNYNPNYNNTQYGGYNNNPNYNNYQNNGYNSNNQRSGYNNNPNNTNPNRNNNNNYYRY